MLETLHVKNLAIIDEVEVNFKRGLNILTGETGAGKSVIIGSMNLALGEKAGKDLLREGAEYGLVELSFFSEDKDTLSKLEEREVYPEEGQVILSRRIMDGRSSCKCNGETVPVSGLKNAAELLIDIHGQHEHQSLLYKKNHITLLDLYAKDELAQVMKSYVEAYAEYRTRKKELSSLQMDHEALARELSLLEFEVNEIENAHLKDGEDESLEADYRKLSNMQKIHEALSYAYGVTSSDAIGSEISRAYREILSVASYDEELSELAAQLGDLDGLLSDFNRSLRAYQDGNVYDAETFALCENRLNEINHLKSKYGKNISDILRYLEDKQKELNELENIDLLKAQREAAFREAEEKLSMIAEQVSVTRKNYAGTLSAAITSAMAELNFNGAEFCVSVEEAENYGADGKDSVEFLVKTNPGESLKPLEKVASGGELSRIMLALISECADNDQIETLIFDEIDTGISGRTAQMVAEKLNYIARTHQVICITHLPQIAAMADTHFVIEKSVENDKTISSIRRLSEAESEEELARLLGGVEITAAVRENAREMKTLAKTKKTIA